MPLAGVITQQVRPGHQAIDISCVPGTPVHAAHAGQGSTRWSRDLGWTFTLNGSDGLQTTYAHLDSGAPAGLFPRGAVIGLCGNTGRLSTGPHLHFGSNQPERLTTLAPPIPLATPPVPMARPLVVMLPVP
jgi:murein DD-endopeptidase MepM/ murein hydrolase activator NlpD